MINERQLTRRQLVKAAGGLAAMGGGGLAAAELLGGTVQQRKLAGSMSGATVPVRRFRSRPDLKPPAVAVTGTTSAPGYVMITPSRNSARIHFSQPGPLMLDARGEPVWFAPVGNSDPLATNLRLGTYQGKPALTWWEGNIVAMGDSYYGHGEGVIADSSYRELARVRAARGRQMDLHEFQVTPRGTALFTCTPEIATVDLSSIGGSSEAQVIESIFQEVDVRTGRLLLEWRSLDHIHPSESFNPIAEPWDFLHLNSIDVTSDGNLLVSGRETWTLFKLDRRTGAIIWRLGGKQSGFAMGKGAQFAWQHHAVRVNEQIITVFDNGSDGPQRTEPQSRALILEVDTSRRTARLGKVYTHPERLSAAAEGSVQVLPDGQVLVCWGFGPYVSQFGPDGTLLTDAHLLPADVNSYRAFRFPWRGQPHEPPAIAAARERKTHHVTVYASWNGATEVRGWRVHVGPTAHDLRPVGVAGHHGFETAIALGTASGYVAVTAIDAAGNRLASSRAIKV